MNQNEIDIFLNEVSAIRKTTDSIKKRYQCFTSEDFSIFELFSPNENTISNVLSYLLDPAQTHCQGRLFLDAFLNSLNGRESINRHEIFVPSFKQSIHVSTEYTIKDNRRIDIVIKSQDAVLAIENKAYGAADQTNQLADYAKWVREEKKTKFLLVYLSQNEPSEDSLGNSDEEREQTRELTVNYTFKNLAETLNRCTPQIKSEKVRVFVECMILYIRSYICGEVTVPNNFLIESIGNDLDKIAAVLEIRNNFDALIESAEMNLLEELTKQVQKEFGDDIKVIRSESLRQRYGGIDFYFNKANHGHWALRFEADNPEMQNMLWGVKWRQFDRRSNDVAIKLAEVMSDTFRWSKGNTQWPWWSWIDKSEDNLIGDNWMRAEIIQMMLTQGETDLSKFIMSRVKKLHDNLSDEDYLNL